MFVSVKGAVWHFAKYICLKISSSLLYEKYVYVSYWALTVLVDKPCYYRSHCFSYKTVLCLWLVPFVGRTQLWVLSFDQAYRLYYLLPWLFLCLNCCWFVRQNQQPAVVLKQQIVSCSFYKHIKLFSYPIPLTGLLLLLLSGSLLFHSRTLLPLWFDGFSLNSLCFLLNWVRLR